MHLKLAQPALPAETMEAGPKELQEEVAELRLSSHQNENNNIHSPSQNRPTTEPKADEESNTDSAMKETALVHDESSEPSSPKSGVLIHNNYIQYFIDSLIIR